MRQRAHAPSVLASTLSTGKRRIPDCYLTQTEAALARFRPPWGGSPLWFDHARDDTTTLKAHGQLTCRAPYGFKLTSTFAHVVPV